MSTFTSRLTRPHRPHHDHRLDNLRKVATITTKEDAAMSTVGVKELKSQLTRYLRRTEQGEEVIIAEWGKRSA